MKDKLAEIIKDEVCSTCGDDRLDRVKNAVLALRTYLIGEIEKLPTYKEHKPGSETEYLLGKDDVIRKIKGE